MCVITYYMGERKEEGGDVFVGILDKNERKGSRTKGRKVGR